MGTAVAKNLDNIKRVISENKDSIVEKRKKTNNHKYGVDHALQSGEILNKVKNTNRYRILGSYWQLC